MPTLLERIVDEVGRGLETEARARIDRARQARRFYDYDGQEESGFRNDAETAADYIRRPYRESGLTREVVDILCEHLYAPGPARTWDEAGADAFLQQVYTDNHINAIMQRAESLATLMDVAAIQIDAADGTYGDRPIRLRLWGADELAVWEDPEDRLVPYAVCTVDQYDLQTRYRLWTAEEVRTFVTRRADGTNGGRVAEPVGPPEPNPYGVLPFSFVHYNLPVDQFWEPGVGDLITGAEIRVNDRLSRLDQAISKHLNPIPILKDAPDNFQVILGQPNLFIRLNRRAIAPGADGGFGGGAPPEPEMSYLEAHIDIEGAWADLRGYIDQVLEAARVPRSAVRMEQTGVASGIALIVEQAPLLTRARRRQLPWGIYEEGLARTILACGGAYYRRAGLSAQARTGRLALGWPMPSIPVQTDDWLQLQLMREQAGLTSKIMITMETYGCSRDQAIAILEQVKEDNEDLKAIMPEMTTVANPPVEQGPDEGEGDEGDEGEGDDGADEEDEADQ